MSRPELPPVPGRLRLLVVDDVEPVRSALSQILEKAGYAVEAAAGAEEALRLSQSVQWDGVVMDVDLAGGSGVELYARLLRQRGDRRLPVVFFSGRPNYALRLGLQGTTWAQVVEKPCGSKPFLAVLAQCLQAGQVDGSAPVGQEGVSSNPP
ncbi:MAG: response regulator [Lacunisphaera sp.]|nr:response regulator [Lacunisphaera sp.]MDB6165881.1 response regulator [Lacunisphaera sp.]